MQNIFKDIFRFSDIHKNKSKLAGYVEACGLDSLQVGKFLAHGMQHFIFEYGKDYVIKIPKFDLFNSFYGILRPAEVESDWKIMNQFFSEYTLDTKIFHTPDKKYYSILQKRLVNFENLTSKNIHEVLKEFQILHKRNHLLESKLGYSLDLWGKSGIIRSFNKSFGRINVFVEMTNIVIDRSNRNLHKLRIVDTNLYRINGQKMTFSRLITDKIISLFSDYFLRKGRFLN